MIYAHSLLPSQAQFEYNGLFPLSVQILGLLLDGTNWITESILSPNQDRRAV